MGLVWTSECLFKRISYIYYCCPVKVKKNGAYLNIWNNNDYIHTPVCTNNETVLIHGD